MTFSRVQPSGVSGIEARQRTLLGSIAAICSRQDEPMIDPSNAVTPADWRRICDALRYLGRDLYHRSFAVTSERRELLWAEMDRCLELAERLSAQLPDAPMTEGSGPEPF